MEKEVGQGRWGNSGDTGDFELGETSGDTGDLELSGTSRDVISLKNIGCGQLQLTFRSRSVSMGSSSIPSYSTSNPMMTHAVAGSHTWSNTQWGSGFGAMVGSVLIL